MTTISTYLAASFVAVTFGWVPSDSASTGAEADGYDYLIKLSPEDLEALRDGRATDLVSELPTDIAPIRRVRVIVGDGAAPQRLTPSDERSPQRLAAAAQARRTQTVAKPVVPEWKDAARLIPKSDGAEGEVGDREDSRASEPLSRKAYQNPNVLRGLSDGFQQGTQDLAEGTRNLFEQGGDNLRNGAQSILRGTSDLLQSAVPRSTTADPPARFDANGYPIDARNSSPAPVYDPSTAPSQTQYTQPPYAAGQYGGQPSPQYDQFGRPLAPPLDQTNNSGISSNGLAESFTNETGSYPPPAQRPMSPVPRSDSSRLADTQSTNNGGSTRSDWDPSFSTDFGVRREPLPDTSGATSGGAFPELRSAAGATGGSTWPGGGAGAGGGTGGGLTAPPVGSFASDQPGFSQTPPATTTPLTGREGPGSASTPPSTQFAGVAGDDRTGVDSRYFEKLLLVILGAATCFTWIAYIDVRNKYRSVLRNTPGGGYAAV